MWLYLNISDRLPTVKSSSTASQSFCQGCLKGNCTWHLSGMTLCLLMATPSMDRLISYMVASPVRTLVLQDLEKAWKESEADYFSRSCAWPKKSSPRSYSLRMCQQSQLETAFEWLVKLPKWGMIVDGVLYPLHPLEHLTKEKDGFYLPTPTTMDSLPPRSIQAQQRIFQTHRKGRKAPSNLRERIHPEMWPTPDSFARGARKNQNGHHFTIQDAVGSGKLNPVWIEWLMGYSKEWTELEPWAMQWFQSKRKKRLKS